MTDPDVPERMKEVDVDGVSRSRHLVESEAFEALRHPSFEVIDYKKDLDDSEIDPDPDFRSFLKLINDHLKVRTVSSCQGHLPGEQYEDVLEIMPPYVTIFGDEDALVAAEKLFSGVLGVRETRMAFPKLTISMGTAVIGAWGPSLASLRQSLAACNIRT